MILVVGTTRQPRRKDAQFIDYLSTLSNDLLAQLKPVNIYDLLPRVSTCDLRRNPKCSFRLLQCVIPLEPSFVRLDLPSPGMVFDVDDEGAGN